MGVGRALGRCRGPCSFGRLCILSTMCLIAPRPSPTSCHLSPSAHNHSLTRTATSPGHVFLWLLHGSLAPVCLSGSLQPTVTVVLARRPPSLGPLPAGPHPLPEALSEAPSTCPTGKPEVPPPLAQNSLHPMADGRWVVQKPPAPSPSWGGITLRDAVNPDSQGPPQGKLPCPQW